MVIEKILGTLGGDEKNVDFVSVEWFECGKKLLKKVSQNGVEIGLRPEKPLRDGDILFNDGKIIIAVRVAPCELIKIAAETMTEMGRLCFEIGNRHLPLAISENGVRIPYDEPTYLYLKKLGFNAERVTEKFTGFTECRAHGAHSHTHEDGHHEHH